MSSGKKGKKTKGKSLSLGEFLGNTTSTGASQVVVAPKTSWADEFEEFEDDRYSQTERIVLPTAPRQARALAIDPDRVPSSPPFTAYVANLPFEVEDEDIERFFNKLKIVNIHLQREGGEGGRFKGYGYVEFETKADLIEALHLNDDMMRNRKIHVAIADDESNNRRSHHSSRDEEREDRSGGVSDWRAAPREAPSGGRDDRSYRNGPSYNDRSPGRGYDDRYADRDRERYNDRGYGRDRFDSRGYRNERDYDRDRGYDRQRDSDRDYNRGGGGRYGSGGRYEDRRYDDRRDGDRRGGGFRRGGDYERRGDRWNGPRGKDDDRDPPKERPKLNLKPRSKPADEKVDAAPATSNPSIFGAAKPVDTAKKDQEIENKYKKEKEQPPPAPPKKETVSAKDIFGAAKPVDTAARERQIEEKLKRLNQDGVEINRDDDKSTNDKEVQRPQVIKLEKKDSVKSGDAKEKERRSEKEKEVSLKEKEVPKEKEVDNGEGKKNQNGEHAKKKNRKWENKAKDEPLIIDTTNKFSQLGLDEEEA